MIIERIQNLPDVAQRSFWSKALRMNPTTFYRAEKRGELTRISTNGRDAVYSKAEVMRWLKLPPNP
jgi:hypothetical protein